MPTIFKYIYDRTTCISILCASKTYHHMMRIYHQYLLQNEDTVILERKDLVSTYIGMSFF